MNSGRIRPGARGFSLVELMVAMVIALVVMAGVVNSLIASKDAFRFNEELAFIQENSRFAMEYLGRDIRGAGYFGCNLQSGHLVNALNLNATSSAYFTAVGLQGYDDSQAVSTFPSAISANVKTGTDVITVRGVDSDNSVVIKEHTKDTSSAQFKLVSSSPFLKGAVLMVVEPSCQSQGIFQQSGNNSGTSVEVVHGTAGGLSPGNCTKAIRGKEDGDCSAGCSTNTCSWENTVTPMYPPGSTVMAFTSNTYYVSESVSDASLPSLYVYGLQATGTLQSNELVAGVEDLQFTFGQDTDDDGNPDIYRDASEVAAGDWEQIVSVRVEMLLRSRSEVLPVAEARTLLGNNYNDRYLRQLVSNTIRVRNHLR